MSEDTERSFKDLFEKWFHKRIEERIAKLEARIQRLEDRLNKGFRIVVELEEEEEEED